MSKSIKALILDAALSEALIAAREQQEQAGSCPKAVPAPDTDHPGPQPAARTKSPPDTAMNVEKAAAEALDRLAAMMRAGQGPWLAGPVIRQADTLIADAEALGPAAQASGIDACVLRALLECGAPKAAIRLKDGNLILRTRV